MSTMPTKKTKSKKTVKYSVSRAQLIDQLEQLRGKLEDVQNVLTDVCDDLENIVVDVDDEVVPNDF